MKKKTPAPLPSTETQPPQAGEALKVLMIEDNRGDYVLTKAMLTDTGSDVRYDLVWQNSLRTGLEALSKGSIDAILLDLNLPDSSGWETFEAVRQHDASVPVILLTGLSDEALGRRAIHEGAQDYLIKGQSDGHLLARAILYAVERKRTSDQLARYARQLRERNEQMLDDIAMAREIQQALLPRRYPRFPRGATSQDSLLRFAHDYRPCATVGGDFFSVSQLSDTQAGILVCDVMGHGMRAALVTAIIRGVIEELEPIATSPGLFLNHLNRGIETILRPSGMIIFASALYAVIDLDSATISYAAAGHAHPYRITPERYHGESLCPPNWPQEPALGIAGSTTYHVVTAPIRDGERYLFFTDGICEPESPKGEPFGQSRFLETAGLKARLAMEDWLKNITCEAQSFCKLTDFDDDVCLLGVEVAKLSQK